MNSRKLIAYTIQALTIILSFTASTLAFVFLISAPDNFGILQFMHEAVSEQALWAFPALALMIGFIVTPFYVMKYVFTFIIDNGYKFSSKVLITKWNGIKDNEGK